jgi:hypothetical protein
MRLLLVTTICKWVRDHSGRVIHILVDRHATPARSILVRKSYQNLARDHVRNESPYDLYMESTKATGYFQHGINAVEWAGSGRLNRLLWPCQNSQDAQEYCSTCIVEGKCNICLRSRFSSRNIFLDSHLAIRSVHTSTIDLCKGLPATRYSVLGLANAYTRSAFALSPSRDSNMLSPGCSGLSVCILGHHCPRKNTFGLSAFSQRGMGLPAIIQPLGII